MYQQIKKQEQDRYNQLFNECGVFWAFSNEQFATNKTPLKEGEKYVSIGAGGFLPKGNVEKLREGMKRIKKETAAAIKGTKGGKRQAIEHELNNHECYYTGDIQPAVEALGKGYTRAEVLKVYNEIRETVNF